MTFVQTEPVNLTGGAGGSKLVELDLEALARAGEEPYATGEPMTPGSGSTASARKATVRRTAHKSPRSWVEAARMSNLSQADSVASSSGGKQRKGEISAEPFPSSDKSQVMYRKVKHAKGPGATKLIRAAVDQCMLFSELSDEARSDLVDAFDKVEARRNEVLIEEGEWGDLFYVLEQGACDASKMVFNQKVNDRVPTKVMSYEPGGSFGELALMYNEPRAATIRVTSEKAVLWAVDRQTSKSVSVHFKMLRSRVYEEAMRRIPGLGLLSSEEMTRLLDVVEERKWAQGTVVAREGDVADEAFAVLEGKLVYKKGGGTAALNPGDFFGEAALTGPPSKRAVTVTCDSSAAVTISVTRLRLDEVVGSSSRDARKDRPKSVMPQKQSAGGHRHLVAMKLEDLETNMKVAVGRAPSPSIAGASGSGAGAVGGTSPPPPPRGAAGSVFLNTDHEGEIVLGVGTFGKVLIVRHTTSGVTYAMKRLNKSWIVANSLEQHVVDERNVMTLTDHPFVLKLHNSYWDDRYVYLVLELCLGGELFSYLRKAGNFNEQQTRFYAASVALAFDHLHSKFIIYRDLKPENLMLDDKGFLKVVDFGLAKVVKGRTWTICGTPEYLAPEVVLSKGHNRGVDYWALGVLIFELNAGYCPFQGSDNMEIYKQIIQNKVAFPQHFTTTCRDIVRDFTKVSQIARLGLRRPGFQAIKDHPWFQGFDWKELETLKATPPIQPKVRSRLDMSNFEDYEEDEAFAKMDADVCDWRPAFPFEVVRGLTKLSPSPLR